MRIAAGYLAGLVFGVGLTVSGMTDPMKVQNFLDVAGLWDPSLAFVMAGAVAVAFAGYRIARRRDAPLFAPRFFLPDRTAIDARLVAGSAVFGLGWGLAGLCPGPAVAGLAWGRFESFVFVGCMVAGMKAAGDRPRDAARRAVVGRWLRA